MLIKRVLLIACLGRVHCTHIIWTPMRIVAFAITAALCRIMVIKTIILLLRGRCGQAVRHVSICLTRAPTFTLANKSWLACGSSLRGTGSNFLWRLSQLVARSDLAWPHVQSHLPKTPSLSLACLACTSDHLYELSEVLGNACKLGQGP